MIITFLGHAQFCKNEEYEKKILAILEEKVGDFPADMYLGGYGAFDNFSYECCKKYKETHKNISLIFVPPFSGLWDKGLHAWRLAMTGERHFC